MEEKQITHICPDCKAGIEDNVLTCPFCGCPVSTVSNNSNSLNNKKRRILGIVLCALSIVCFIWGINRITNDKYSFYIEHRNECQANQNEVQYLADTSNGYFKSSYQNMVDDYEDMIKDDQKEIWTYRIEAIFSCSVGITLLITGVKKTKYKE